MKKIGILLLLAFVQILSAQNVILNKVLKVNDNKDKILYKIAPETSGAEYLGELEVQGFSENDVETFGKIYQKAKQIGANTFAWIPFETIDVSVDQIDPSHYLLALYYMPAEKIPAENNVVYLISSPLQKQTISFNREKIILNPKTFTKRLLSPGEIYTVSTRKLLGSSIKLSAKGNQAALYFQISGFQINTNVQNSPGLNLKSGDIMKLEQSYAQFLTAIYKEF